MTIIDFTNPVSCLGWQCINDGVMGGISRSSFEYNSQGAAVFFGIVSLENSGGFASVRSLPSLRDLSTYTGLILRVRGDGKRYKLNLRNDPEFDGIQYQAPFVTVKAEWTDIRIAFTEFTPMFRGRIITDAPPLNTSAIHTFGFLISDKQDGPFSLEIESISAL